MKKDTSWFILHPSSLSAAGVVPAVALPLEPDAAAQPAAGAAARAVAPVRVPEPQAVAGIDALDLRRVHELGQVLHLPQAPRPGVARQAVQVDEVDAALPARGGDGRGVTAGDVVVAQVQVLVEAA